MAVAVVGVYRARHVGVVRALLAGAPLEWVVRLWSLDPDPPPDLAGITAGIGPGTRFALLNQLAEGVPVDDRRDGLVLTDDDVRFDVGDLGRLVEAGQRLGLDLYQPGHQATTIGSWTFVRRRPLTFGRETRFVEQGPLLVLSAAAQRVLLPLPEDLGMAWGVEARWSAACARAGLRQGIVDAVGVRHLGAVAAAYDRAGQEAQLARELQAAGLADLTDLQQTVARVGVRAGRRSRPDPTPARPAR
jgi:hypothetical protein